MLKAKCGIILPMEVIKKYLPNKPYLAKGSVMFLASLLILGVATPTGVSAGFFDDIIINGAGGILTSTIGLLLSFLLVIAAGFANFAGSFMEWVLNWDMFYTKCVGVPENKCFIDIGWKLARDLVNALLIVALVVIALSTILGKREYGITSSLIPLMLVALLVNFSRVVVGMVIDGANIVMDVFVQAMPGIADSTSSITKSAGVGDFSFSFDTATAATNLFETIIMIIFFFGLGFILFLYGIIFAVRFAMLWMLTIMSPIAFLAYIFPTTKKIFNFWRDQLIQWAVIGIPVLFFLWVALLFAARMDDMVPSGDAGFFAAIMPSIFLLIMLGVAFILGLRTSAMGSAAIISTGKKFGAATGMFAGKWGAKLAYRATTRGIGAGVRGAVGGGKAAGRYADPRLRALGQKIKVAIPPLRAVSAWRTGAARRRFDIAKNRGRMLQDANILGQKDKNGNFVTKSAAWGDLTGDQQIRVKESYRSPTAKGAAAILGGGKQSASWLGNKAKYLANTPFKLLTPEERKALWSAVTFAKLRTAQKAATGKELKALEALNLSISELRETIRKSSKEKKFAAQILLAQQTSPEDFNREFSPSARATLAKEARRLGLGKELFAYQPQLINDALPGTDPDTLLKRAKVKKDATSKAGKEIKDAYETMLNLLDDEVVLLGEKGNALQKLAAAQTLADRHELGKLSDPGAAIESARQFNQEHLILRRYLHMTKDKPEMKKVTEKMSDRDYPFIHEGILDISTPKSLGKFEDFWEHASRAGIGQMIGRKDLASAMQAIASDTKNHPLLEKRKDIDRFMRIRSKSNVVFGIPWTGKSP